MLMIDLLVEKVCQIFSNSFDIFQSPEDLCLCAQGLPGLMKTNEQAVFFLCRLHVLLHLRFFRYRAGTNIRVTVATVALDVDIYIVLWHLNEEGNENKASSRCFTSVLHSSTYL